MAEAAAGSKTIGAVNEASSDLARRVYAERVRLFYKQQTTTILASSTIACFLVTILWSEFGISLPLLGWLGTMLTIQLGRLVVRVLYLRAGLGTDDAPRWGRIAVLMTAAAGICWGASVLLFFDPASPMNLVAMTMTATGIAAGGLAVLSALPVAYLAYLASHVPPVIFVLAITGEFVNIVFAACFVFFLIVLISAARAM